MTQNDVTFGTLAEPYAREMITPPPAIATDNRIRKFTLVPPKGAERGRVPMTNRAD